MDQTSMMTVKPEIFSQNYSTKKLDIVDKWRARVLLCNGVEENSWIRKIDKQMAVLRVSYPFLTERQLRGKAWKSCGLKSVMGGVPRFGLSPKIKKEFIKQEKIIKRRDAANMPQKPRIKKEKVKSEMDVEKCPFTFKETHQPSQVQNPLATYIIETQSKPLNIPNELSTPEKKKSKKGLFQIVCSPQENSSLTKDIEPKIIHQFNTVAPSLSLGSDYFLASQDSTNSTSTKECSKVVLAHEVISTEQNSCLNSSKTAVSNYAYPVSQESTMDSVTIPSLANATINTASRNFSSSQITSIKNSNVNKEKKLSFETVIDDYKNDLISNSLKESLNTQDLLRSAMMDCSNLPMSIEVSSKDENCIDQNSKNIYINSGENVSPKILDNSTNELPLGFYDVGMYVDVNTDSSRIIPENMNLNSQINQKNIKNQDFSLNYVLSDNFKVDERKWYKEEESYIDQNSYDICPITPFQTQDVLSQHSIHPLVIPPSTLLSNFCSEYDLAYAKPDLKPNLYDYSLKHDEFLKLEMSQIIPANLCLKEFFKAKDRSFKKVKLEVKKKVKKIIQMLEKEAEKKEEKDD